jgi:integrase/recombinase XerD
LQDKHLLSFINESIGADIDVRTLKTDLAAIRKLHKLTKKTRYNLTVNNDQLGVEKRVKKKADRAWTDGEYNNAINLALSMNRNDVVWSLKLAMNCGVRLEECTALTKSQLKGTLDKGFLSLRNTKNGILRDIPLDKDAKIDILCILKEIPSERERIFVYHGRNHQQAKKSIQNWIMNNRAKFKDPLHLQSHITDNEKYEVKAELTFHGLRHSFARRKYKEFLAMGFKQQKARKCVAEILGHGRDDVTLIYL